MKIIKKNKKKNPKLSFILLDWSVRESFHILHYLSLQNCNREDFEVVIIEYYDRESNAIKQFESQVDTWVLLDMPHDYYYHKHLMYNVGIYFSKGEYISICDSDAMVKPDHVNNIIDHFNNHPDSVFHIDQFRNNKQELYPFNYPDFDTVTGEGCINFMGNKTTGVCDIHDPIHSRNYGACMCAKRDDVINIGGADEHIDFVGHICGPYDLTFRLINAGKEEIWSEHEFTYHTWHPGQAGIDNYLGPHDGKNMSTTSLISLISGRILPLVENKTIKALRENIEISPDETLAGLINTELSPTWNKSNLDGKSNINYQVDRKVLIDTYYGARIFKNNNTYSYDWITDEKNNKEVINFKSIDQLKSDICSKLSLKDKFIINLFVMLLKILHYVRIVVIVIKKPSRLIKNKNINIKMQRSSQQRNNTTTKIIDLITYILKNGNSKIIIMKYDELVILSLKIFQYIKLLPQLSLEIVADCNQVKSVLKNTPEKFCIPAGTYIQFYTEFSQIEKESITIV